MINQSSDTLPEGWTLTTLSDVFEINPPKPDLSGLSDDDEVTFIPMGAVDDKSGSITRPETRKLYQVPSGFTCFREGDVIMAKITPCMENGKAAIATDLRHGIAFGSTEFHVLRTNCPVTAKYLHHFIRQTSFRKAAEAEMSGTGGLRRVSADYLKKQAFPFPPLAEQKRIVEKMDSVMEQAKITHAEVENGFASVTSMREKALNDAFSGNRTGGYEKPSDSDGDAASRLAWLKNCLLSSVANKKEIRIIEDLFQMPPIAQQGAVFSAAPERFLRCRIGMVVRVSNGSTPSRKVPAYWGGDIPWVSSGQVRDNVIDGTREYITKEGFERLSSRLLPKGTILMAMVGEGKTRGQTALLDIEATINQNIAALEPNPDAMLPKYLWYWLQFRYEANRREGGGSGPQALNCQAVRELPLLLPALNEQKEIVRQLEASLSEAAVLELQLIQTAAVANNMVKTALTSAFRGKLVPTEVSLTRAENRSYESAETLLARIKAQLASRPPARRRLSRSPKLHSKRRAMSKQISEVLQGNSKPVPVEQVFRETGRKQNEVEQFFVELRRLEKSGQVILSKSNTGGTLLASIQPSAAP